MDDAPISFHILSALRWPRLLSLLREDRVDSQQDQRSSSSTSDRSGVGSRGGDGAFGSTFKGASGLALALMQSTVQLTVDICIEHTGCSEGLRASRLEGRGAIRCCRGIGDDDLCALFTAVALRALTSLRLECFSFTVSRGKSTKSSGGSGDPDWWITTFFECLLFLGLTS